MHIDIYHDTVCPWCRIGKRNLQIALESWHDEPVTIDYHTFFLNNAIPLQGADFHAIMNAKTGGQVPLEAMFDGPRQAGARVGLTFNFEAITRAPNTTLSHRLIALTPDGQKVAMIDAIYKAYFEDGLDIGDLDVLLAIAGAVGLEVDAIARDLKGDTAEAEVLAEAEHAHQLGITGVPFFIFNGRYAISGAQPPAVMVQTLRQVAERSKKDGVSQPRPDPQP